LIDFISELFLIILHLFVILFLLYFIEDLAMLTTDSSLTNIWVVSMSEINFNSLNNIKKISMENKKNGIQYSRIVAFQPTGWSHTAKSNITTISSMLHPRIKDGNTIYSTPYSEHSSFDELIDFVKKITPNRIVPTVNCSTPEKIKEQVDLLLHFSGLFVKKNPITSIITDSSNNIREFS
jgi:DNA cross-link repair 1A protein